MIINEKIKSNLPIQNFNKLFAVTDFDRTITNGNSKTSWSILSSSNLVPKNYIYERQKLYDTYRPIELDESLDFSIRNDMMKQWFKKHIELFVKYEISENIFIQSANNLNIMEFRKGAKSFLEFLYENNIPLIIISAGIGNFIEYFLKLNDCYYDNIYISSNKILFKNGVASSDDNNIIHSLNKNDVSLPTYIKEKLVDKTDVILLGDQISDLKMVNRNKYDKSYTIDFLNDETELELEQYKEAFDIICEKNDDFSILKDLLFYI